MAVFSDIRNWDRVVMGLLALLLLFGLVVLFSASSQKQADTGKNFVITQVISLIAGLSVMLLVARTNYHSFLSVAYIIYGLQVGVLILVLAMGKTALGAQRWISVGGFTMQPSEFAKIITILALARIIGDAPQKLRTVSGLIWPLLITFVPMLLIFKQPDLGTAIVFLPIFLMMLWVGGVRLKYFVTIIASGLLSLPLLWHFLKDYQRDRLMVFINPDLDPLGAGYTINQSKIAIGSGMFIGKGWLAGTQNRLSFLPERHTDFIFSVVGEEWGYIGTMCVLMVFLFLLLRGVRIAETTHDLSGRLVATGITTLLALHVIINIGMTLGLMPVVGMPLPFISYGGSALLSNLIALGFLLNVRLHRTVF
ncbi:MAG: rod shape-determining protein RodA [Candidatus Omnitrophica bacterium]|nr:rod shape-determining protein RodA [Candidatus Omnitrophota bacterium]